MSLHQGGSVVAAGAPLAAARAAVVALHGRGATAAGIADFLAGELDVANTAIVAPQARHGTWYPQSFLAPFAANQP
ncbi:MAG: phospholipase, partial [Thermoanaerobaculia bacterium]|nr:phospholipase [Thermoanaerobaculia bacterium]